MRVAFYCPNKPLSHPTPSGDLTIARDLRDSLLANDHECEEIVSFRSRRFWQSHSGWFQAFKALALAYRNAVRFRPGIWLTYHSYYKAPDCIGPLLSRLLDIPYVLFEPSYATKHRRDPAHRIGFHLNRFALRSCRQAFINTTNDRDALLRVLSPRRIAYVPPGVDPDLFQRDSAAGAAVRGLHGISPDEPLILSVARFRPGAKMRSLEHLFHSLAFLHREGIPFRLVLVGDGPMETEVRTMINALLPGRAVLAGRIPHSRMVRYYSAADIFAFPGIGESLGMVYLEAQACGVPVVALETGGVPQVVRTGKTGLLVPVDNGSAMASALEKLLTDADLRNLLGSAARQFVCTERNLPVNNLRFCEMLETIVLEEGP